MCLLRLREIWNNKRGELTVQERARRTGHFHAVRRDALSTIERAFMGICRFHSHPNASNSILNLQGKGGPNSQFVLGERAFAASC